MIEAVNTIGIEPIESSSTIAGIGYDNEAEQLVVVFHSGDVVRYSGVDVVTAAEFYGAESKGKHYAARIRGKFTSEKLTGLCGRCKAKGLIGTMHADCGGTFVEIDRVHQEPLALQLERSIKATKKRRK